MIEKVKAEREAWRAGREQDDAGEGHPPRPLPNEDDIKRLISNQGGDTRDKIALVCDELRDFLVSKNEQYGNSAIEPVRIFSRASAVEQLYVRIDDKLSRLARGDDRLESDEDVVDDLIGYLILLKVARRGDE